MDDRDRWAASTSVIRILVGYYAFWALWLAAPLLFGGVTRGEVVLLAVWALAGMCFVHLVRWASGLGRTATSGPFAGLGPADWWEVAEAVRQGRAVSDPRLAGPAVEHARQRRRIQGFGRVAFPVVIVLRIVTLAADPPGPAGPVMAYGAVVVAPLLALWILDLRGWQRSDRSEAANWRLIEGGGAR